MQKYNLYSYRDGKHWNIDIEGDGIHCGDQDCCVDVIFYTGQLHISLSDIPSRIDVADDTTGRTIWVHGKDSVDYLPGVYPAGAKTVFHG